MPALELIGLSKRYGDTVAVEDLGFSVAEGQVFGFVGPNGAGKTTTMRIAIGVLAPDAGEVLWDGAPADVDARRRFGYMPEERGLYPKMRVGDQLAYLAELHGLGDSEAAAAAEHWTERLGIARPAQRRGREALAGQPAAGPARRGARPRARAADPRRALQRP